MIRDEESADENLLQREKKIRLLSNKLGEKFMFSLLCAFNENTISIGRRRAGDR